MTGRVLQFPLTPRSLSEAAIEAARILALPPEERDGPAIEKAMEEPELLLAVCASLRCRLETGPAEVRDEAEFFYKWIDVPERTVGVFDEKEYFLGETALLAGSASRILFRRDEARRWFDRSETAFRHTVNAIADWARVAYQRLALRTEEREFEEVLELLPSLVETFRKLGMSNEALKCRFLEGVIDLNTQRYDKAVCLFREISVEARRLKNESLLAVACNNLVSLQGLLGHSEEALEQAQETLKVFQQLDNRVGLAKLQCGIGILMRTRGNLAGAIEAIRAAKEGFVALQMRSDVATMSLLLADLELDTGDERGAIRELLTALPVIQAENMVPEGMAAWSLLQESVRHRRVDRDALRQLHGYFENRRPT
ncbi:MAG: hypothetical protein ABI592_00990 [Acidobacteriota bacterium]